MHKSNHERIRKILKTVDGATVMNLADIVGINDASVREALRNMPDTYIDRWLPGTRGSWQAVWCVVDVPDDCPKPTRSNHES